MSIFAKLIRRRYVGLVSATTYLIDRNGVRIPGQVEIDTWILTESIFGRAAKHSGTFGGSPKFYSVRGRVEAWLKGGPVPSELHPGDAPKPKAKLIVFPGGKGGAA